MSMPTNPYLGSPAVVGPSADFFPLVVTAHSDTLPFDTAAGTPKLPKVLRKILCVANSTITIQSLTGGTATLAMTAGQVHDLGYVCAVNFAADSKFVGYA